MFRFTIRDVLWLTVVVAVCCAWWLHRHYADSRLQAQRDFLFNKVQSLQRKAETWEAHARHLAFELKQRGLNAEFKDQGNTVAMEPIRPGSTDYRP